MRPRHIAPFVSLVLASGLSGQTGRVRGVVYDSVNRRPLADAGVEVVDIRAAEAAPRRARTDSAGQFEVTGLTAGQYLVGFFHPLLDALSLPSPTTHLVITGGETIAAPLAIPSLSTIARERCPRTADVDTLSTLIGRVLDASRLVGVDGASVRVWWRELYVTRGGVTHVEPGETLTTFGGGGFAFCGIPSATEIGIVGWHGTDSTDLVVALTKEHGIIRRDLFIGHVDTASADTPAIVRGVVRDNSGRPLPNAQVRVVNGAQVARSGDDGRYELRAAAVGTREIEFRLVGFMPQTNLVDLHRGAATIVDAKLLTVRQMMDTVKVVSSRLYDRDRNGFSSRRRTHVGTFFDAADIERLRATEVSRLFERANGVTIELPRFGTARYLTMRDRGGASPGGKCQAAVYIDNLKYDALDMSDLDSWIPPNAVAGIEIYDTPATAPPQFQTLNRCGTVVIWTRVPPPTKKP